MNICETCGRDFEVDYRKDLNIRKTPIRFCSRVCANTRDHSEKVRQKIASSLQGVGKYAKDDERLRVTCTECGKVFYREPGRRRCTCSSGCVKARQSRLRSEWLSDPKNRGKYGRGKKSYMETYFENFLNKNSIEGWEDEKHFWNPELKKNYFVDFIFEDRKLIIELDGTQHRCTEQADSLRDAFLRKQGYRVRRIPYKEWQEGEWETGILQLLLRKI